VCWIVHTQAHTDRLRAAIGADLRLTDALFKTEHARITTAITADQARPDSLQHDVEAAQANLHKALTLVQDCETAYLDAPDTRRRQFNQAFFRRLLVDDDFNMTSELAEPFAILLSDEMRTAAAQHRSTSSGGDQRS